MSRPETLFKTSLQRFVLERMRQLIRYLCLFQFLFLLILFMMTKSEKKEKKKRSRFKEEYLKKKDSTSQNSLQVLTKMYVTYVKTRDVIQNVFVEIYSRENVSTDQRSLFAFVFTPLDTLHDDFLSSTLKSVFFLIMTLHLIVKLVYCCKLCLIDSLKANTYSLELRNFYIRLYSYNFYIRNNK